MNIEVEIPLTKHSAVLYSNARHKALYGGRGGGKSWAVATYLIIEAAKSRKRIVCARQFQNSIRDSSKELIEKRIRDLELYDQFTITAQAIIHNETQSEFVFIGLERNPDSIRSFEGADIVWIEEARMISAKSMEILLPTVRNENSELIWTWNPEQRTDPVDVYFRGGNPPAGAVVAEVSYRDNPFFAQTSMPAEMAKLKQDNLARYRHIWEGAYDESYESKVFVNVVVGRPDALPNTPPLYGMDFGYSSDPTAIIKVYHLPNAGQLYIAAETYAYGLSFEQLPTLLDGVVHDRGALIRADGARPDTIDYLKRRSFGINAARKGPGSVKEGVAFLQGFQLLVDPSCKFMLDELRGYRWPTDRLTGLVVPDCNPVGVNDHLLDCLRYATQDLIVDAPLDPDDDGVMLLSLWKPTSDPRDKRWHERVRR